MVRRVGQPGRRPIRKHGRPVPDVPRYLSRLRRRGPDSAYAEDGLGPMEQKEGRINLNLHKLAVLAVLYAVASSTQSVTQFLIKEDETAALWAVAVGRLTLSTEPVSAVSSGTAASCPPVPACPACPQLSTGPYCQKASTGDCFINDRVNPNGSHVPEPARYIECDKWPCKL